MNPFYGHPIAATVVASVVLSTSLALTKVPDLRNMPPDLRAMVLREFGAALAALCFMAILISTLSAIVGFTAALFP